MSNACLMEEAKWWKYVSGDTTFSIQKKSEGLDTEGFTEEEALKIGEQLFFAISEDNYFLVNVNGEEFYVRNTAGCITLPSDRERNLIKSLDKNLFYDA